MWGISNYRSTRGKHIGLGGREDERGIVGEMGTRGGAVKGTTSLFRVNKNRDQIYFNPFFPVGI